jgi:hypothetical protein
LTVPEQDENSLKETEEQRLSRLKSGGHWPLSPEEVERRRLGTLRLKERLSKVPFYAESAKGDPDYWEKFYLTRINT